jgi:hypothetical protein
VEATIATAVRFSARLIIVVGLVAAAFGTLVSVTVDAPILLLFSGLGIFSAAYGYQVARRPDVEPVEVEELARIAA